MKTLMAFGSFPRSLLAASPFNPHADVDPYQALFAAMRLPASMVGTPADMNYASAKASIRVAEARFGLRRAPPPRDPLVVQVEEMEARAELYSGGRRHGRPRRRTDEPSGGGDLPGGPAWC